LVSNSSMSILELIRACAESNDDVAWEEFVAWFHRPIRISIIGIAAQWGASAQQLVDDLVQETYLKLCAEPPRPVISLESVLEFW
jgi:RNA polymerase sigma-70 factor (ECF subfamily)